MARKKRGLTVKQTMRNTQKMIDAEREEVKALSNEQLQSYRINALTEPGYRMVAMDEIERRRAINAAGNLTPKKRIADLERRVHELEKQLSDLANRGWS